MAERKIAPDVEAIAIELIGEFHDHIRSNGVKILYVHSDQDKATRGKSVIAETLSLGGMGAWLSSFVPGAHGEYDYAIVVYGSIWEGLNAKQRQAAIDNELCKFVEKTVQHRDGEETVIKLVDYDWKGFTANIERFGLWRPALRIFAAKAKQLPLDMVGVGGTAGDEVSEESEGVNAADVTEATEAKAQLEDAIAAAGPSDEEGPGNDGGSFGLNGAGVTSTTSGGVTTITEDVEWSAPDPAGQTRAARRAARAGLSVVGEAPSVAVGEVSDGS